MKKSAALVQMDQPQLPAAIEAALIGGDLSKLDQPGRLSYYKAVCESVGLNSLTQPFEYIFLNGKLRLYAKKDCTDQLRNIHKVSVVKLEKERIEDVYVVTAYVVNAGGRQDSSVGAVTIAGAKGDNLANLLMKAETKAKRRATLSICGLGILDETEIETVPTARPFVEQPMPPQPEPEPKPLLTRQLEASIALVQPQPEPEYVSEPEAEYHFHVSGNLVVCKPVQVLEKKTKGGKDYIFMKLDGDVRGLGSAFCYHAGLRDALLAIKECESVCQFEWSIRNDFLQIDDVLDIAGQEYRDGKPFNGLPEVEPEPQIGFDEEELPF